MKTNLRSLGAPSITVKTLAIVGLLASSLLGCAAEAQEEEAASSEAAASQASYPAELQPFIGSWTFAETRLQLLTKLAKEVRVDVETNVRVGDMDNGTVLSIRDPAYGDGVKFRDRAPFLRIGAARSCSSVDQGGGASLSICHQTRVLGSANLEHTVTLTEYNLYLVPTDSSTSTQRLTIEGGRLHYEYAIDGVLKESFFFERAR